MYISKQKKYYYCCGTDEQKTHDDELRPNVVVREIIISVIFACMHVSRHTQNDRRYPFVKKASQTKNNTYKKYEKEE